MNTTFLHGWQKNQKVKKYHLISKRWMAKIKRKKNIISFLKDEDKVMIMNDHVDMTTHAVNYFSNIFCFEGTLKIILV